MFGCASTPQRLDPFRSMSKFDPEQEPSYQFQLPATEHYSVKQVIGENTVKRNWLVSPSGKIDYRVSQTPERLLPIGVMTAYSQGKTSTASEMIYSLEKDFDRYVDSGLVQHLPKLDPLVLGIQIDQVQAFRKDALDRALQLGSRDSVYIYTENWLKKLRKTSSLLSVDDSEREKFLSELISSYFSRVMPKIRSQYPKALIFSQPFTQDDLKISSLAKTLQYCDVIVLRYPGEDRVAPSVLAELIAQVSKPIYFLDVPTSEALRTALPLLSNPQVVGWQWKTGEKTPEESLRFMNALNSALPKLTHYLDLNGLPSNY